MEPPDKPTKEKCPGCGNPFKSVKAHITRSKTCNGVPQNQSESTEENVVTKSNTKSDLKRKHDEASLDSKQKRALRNKRYYQSHKKEFKEHNQNYYQKHKEEFKEHNQDYYQKHKKELREKYQTNRVKIAEKYKEMTKSLQNFYKEIQFGPIFPCICCMRCLPFRSVTRLSEKFFQKCVENDSSDNLRKEEYLKVNGNWYLCSTCYSHLSKGNMPTQCHKNGLDLANVPECLKISDVGNQMLAKNLVFIKVNNFDDYFPASNQACI